VKSVLVALASLAVAGALAAAARADGLPVVGVDVGATGVAGASSDRFVALRARGDTLVARVRRSGGQVLASRVVPGPFTIPAVAYDGSAAGLSADGATLVLIRPRVRFPQRETVLAVFDAERLRVREVVTLRGDFSFDALSPAGTKLYLVQYLSAKDPTRYAVRAYDLRAGRLLRAPVIDPTEPEEDMGGYPITRATSPDGRWAYTLYDRPGKEPFIHALDTVGVTARCIDLDELAGRQDLYDLRLDAGAGGGTLAVRSGDEALAVVNTETFAVSEPAEPAARAARPASQADGGGLPWPLLAAPLAGVALALTAVVTLRVRGTARRRPV
jgi:hypothetical protein